MSDTALTTLLAAARRGDRISADELFRRLYDDLERLARAQLGRGGRRTGDTLDTTVLVHEA